MILEENLNLMKSNQETFFLKFLNSFSRKPHGQDLNFLSPIHE